jgi:hypothetical protein
MGLLNLLMPAPLLLSFIFLCHLSSLITVALKFSLNLHLCSESVGIIVSQLEVKRPPDDTVPSTSPFFLSFCLCLKPSHNLCGSLFCSMFFFHLSINHQSISEGTSCLFFMCYIKEVSFCFIKM